MKRISSIIALILVAVLSLGSLAACQDKPADDAPGTDPVTLKVAGAWEDCIALEEVGRLFTDKYPNCTVTYEYVQNYEEAILKRLTGDDPADLYFTSNLDKESDLTPQTLELFGREDLDLSGAFKGLIDNFSIKNDETGKEELYVIPLGGEMRGLFVNKTLLAKHNIQVPTDQASFLAACDALKKEGLYPVQANPGTFSQQLLYPWVCSLIANADDYQATYDKVAARDAGLSELFSAPFEFMYTLVENNYYDYKKVEKELGLFTDTADEDTAKYFLNIGKVNEEDTKVDDIGQVAFMPGPLSLKSVVDKTKNDYHSEIDYCFILAPVSPDGGFAYLSPAHGIAVNKSSANVDWSVKFLDFLFTPENNTVFAEAFNVIPNTVDAYTYIKTEYGVSDKNVCEVGQVSFDYSFYSIIKDNLIAVSKANAPKYMKEDPSGTVDFTKEDGTTVKVTMYPLDYYMDALEKGLTEK